VSDLIKRILKGISIDRASTKWQSLQSFIIKHTKKLADLALATKNQKMIFVALSFVLSLLVCLFVPGDEGLIFNFYSFVI
jgi:hypothetical protein